VIVLAVVADVYNALLSASGRSLVKIEKHKEPRQLTWGIPNSTWIMLERLPLKNTKQQPQASYYQFISANHQ
jgi:hypothetical protein